MKKLLKWVAEEMRNAGIAEYHFRRNKKRKIVYPYFVGDLFSVIPITEDGKQEYSLVISAFNRTPGTLDELYTEAEKIADHFHHVEGCVGLVGGHAFAAYFNGIESIDTEDEQLSRVDIALTITTWKER